MTKNCTTPLTIMFFCDWRESRQARLRCIMSWSRPVMAIAMKTPATNCFQKYDAERGSSKKNIRAVWCEAITPGSSPNP